MQKKPLKVIDPECELLVAMRNQVLRHTCQEGQLNPIVYVTRRDNTTGRISSTEERLEVCVICDTKDFDTINGCALAIQELENTRPYLRFATSITGYNTSLSKLLGKGSGKHYHQNANIFDLRSVNHVAGLTSSAYFPEPSHFIGPLSDEPIYSKPSSKPTLKKEPRRMRNLYTSSLLLESQLDVLTEQNDNKYNNLKRLGRPAFLAYCDRVFLRKARNTGKVDYGEVCVLFSDPSLFDLFEQQKNDPTRSLVVERLFYEHLTESDYVYSAKIADQDGQRGIKILNKLTDTESAKYFTQNGNGLDLTTANVIVRKILPKNYKPRIDHNWKKHEATIQQTASPNVAQAEELISIVAQTILPTAGTQTRRPDVTPVTPVTGDNYDAAVSALRKLGPAGLSALDALQAATPEGRAAVSRALFNPHE